MNELFWAAVNSGLILGLIHGVNPCGHSWIALTPFTMGNKNAGQVSILTISFISGTAAACLAIGATLGMVSVSIPAGVSTALEYIVTGIIIALGAAMMINPHLLHSHDHCEAKKVSYGALGLFGIGFVNMIIPCPTLTVMYGYAIKSGSMLLSVIVFASYAVATGLAVAAVIFSIHKVSELVHKLHSHTLEERLMRGAGLVTILFGVITLFTE
jgi:nickel/cobalt exporter